MYGGLVVEMESENKCMKRCNRFVTINLVKILSGLVLRVGAMIWFNEKNGLLGDKPK